MTGRVSPAVVEASRLHTKRRHTAATLRAHNRNEIPGLPTRFLPGPFQKMPAPGLAGMAQIALTLPVKLHRGQACKHYIWCALSKYRVILHTPCNTRSKNREEREEEGRIARAQSLYRTSSRLSRKLFNLHLKRHSLPCLCRRQIPLQSESQSTSHAIRTLNRARRHSPCRWRQSRCQQHPYRKAETKKTGQPNPAVPRPTKITHPVSQRTNKSTQSRDRSSEYETSHWAHANYRPVNRIPSSRWESSTHPENP
jgi:hypothetical protein